MHESSAGRSGVNDALPAGADLGGYTVDAVLGQGGFGIVYRARHKELHFLVAIKEYFPTEMAIRSGTEVRVRSEEGRKGFEDGLRRFLEEARALVALRDVSFVVECRDLFRANGTAYLVMEYEVGLPLSEVLVQREAAGTPFTESDLFAVVIPLVEGLAKVHSAGVFHRDIKPSNILIRRADEQPVLIDFGASKQALAVQTKSLAPYTAGYAAPEQVGAEESLGPWTDIYAVGAVMWRIVAGGARPWDPPNPAKAESRLLGIMGTGDPLPTARTLGAGRFSEAVLAVIDQCLAVRAAERVQSCGDLLRMLGPDVARDSQTEESRASRPFGVKPNGESRGGNEISLPVQAICGELSEPTVSTAARTSQIGSGSKRPWGMLAGAAVLMLVLGWLGLERLHHQLEYYTLGSGQEDIVEIQGPPDRVGRYFDGAEWWEEWYYGNDLVEIRDGQVVGWENYAGSLNVKSDVGSNATRKAFLTLQSHRDDVARLHGTPRKITVTFPGDKMLWIYGNYDTSVEIWRRSGRVCGWDNTNGSLNVKLEVGPNITERAYFTRGSHSDEVVRLHGTPDRIARFESHYIEWWHYGTSKVKIAYPGGQVLDWSDSVGNLKARQPDSE